MEPCLIRPNARPENVIWIIYGSYTSLSAGLYGKTRRIFIEENQEGPRTEENTEHRFKVWHPNSLEE